MNDLTEAFRFHEHNGGYCTPPGRAACGLDAARAETRLDRLGERAEFVVDWDEEPPFHDEPEVIARLESGETEWLRAHVEIDGTVLASLGGIELLTENASRRNSDLRVLRAQLAQEAFGSLDPRGPVS